MPEPFAVLDAVHQSQATNFNDVDSKMLYQSDSAQIERAGDSKLFVKFYSKPMKLEEESLKEGRAIFEDKVWINIKLPGDKNNDVNRIAFPEDIMRFPIHYERFRKGQEQVIGSPLTALPFLSEAQVSEYNALFIKTVEQLAGLPDTVCQRILGAVTHRTQAQEWLDAFKGAAQLRKEFEAKEEDRKKQDAARDQQLADLQAQLAALTSKGQVQAQPAQVKK